MSAAPIDRAARQGVLRFDHVSKVFCRQLNVARRYAFADILRGGYDRVGSPRRLEARVVHDVSFEATPGRPLMVVGTPGSGKTTIADLITGQHVPDGGHVTRVGTVGTIGSGKYGQNPFMRLREYLRLVAALQGVPVPEIPAFCHRVLEWTGLTTATEEIVFDLPDEVKGPITFVSSVLAEHDIYVFDDFRPLDDSELGQRLSARIADLANTRICVFLGRAPQPLPRPGHFLLLHGGEVLFQGDGAEGLRVCELFARLSQRNRVRTNWNAAEHYNPVPPLDEARALVEDLHTRVLNADPRPEHEIVRLARSHQPIILGPCVADVSWEVLYWLPFLHWAVPQLNQTPPLAISRSGLRPWYDGLATDYQQISQLMKGRDYKRLRGEHLKQAYTVKQRQFTVLDQRLIELGQAAAHLSDPAALHPAALLRLIQEAMRGRVAPEEITKRAIYQRLPPPEAPIPDLPQEYVVASIRFPAKAGQTPAMNRRVVDLIREVSQRVPVAVLLDEPELPHAFDDGGRGVYLINTAGSTDKARLDRVRAIGMARAMIGTLKGYVALAPFFGVPSMCITAPQAEDAAMLGTLAFAAGELQSPFVRATLDDTTTAIAVRWLDSVLDGPPAAGGPRDTV